MSECPIKHSSKCNRTEIKTFLWTLFPEKTFFHRSWSTFGEVGRKGNGTKQIRNPFEIKPHKAHILLSTAERIFRQFHFQTMKHYEIKCLNTRVEGIGYIKVYDIWSRLT